jgi:hypothetical protein
MLRVKDIREAVDEVYKAMDHFRNHDTVYDVSIKVGHDLRDALSCCYKIYKGKNMNRTSNNFGSFLRNKSNFRQILLFFLPKSHGEDKDVVLAVDNSAAGSSSPASTSNHPIKANNSAFQGKATTITCMLNVIFCKDCSRLISA